MLISRSYQRSILVQCLGINDARKEYIGHEREHRNNIEGCFKIIYTLQYAFHIYDIRGFDIKYSKKLQHQILKKRIPFTGIISLSITFCTKLYQTI